MFFRGVETTNQLYEKYFETIGCSMEFMGLSMWKNTQAFPEGCDLIGGLTTHVG